MAGGDMVSVARRCLASIDEAAREGRVPSVQETREAAGGVSDAYFCTVIRALAEEGYVAGVSFETYIDGSREVRFDDARLTFKGARAIEPAREGETA